VDTSRGARQGANQHTERDVHRVLSSNRIMCDAAWDVSDVAGMQREFAGLAADRVLLAVELISVQGLLDGCLVQSPDFAARYLDDENVVGIPVRERALRPARSDINIGLSVAMEERFHRATQHANPMNK